MKFVISAYLLPDLESLSARLMMLSVPSTMSQTEFLVKFGD